MTKEDKKKEFEKRKQVILAKMKNLDATIARAKQGVTETKEKIETMKKEKEESQNHH